MFNVLVLFSLITVSFTLPQRKSIIDAGKEIADNQLRIVNGNIAKDHAYPYHVAIVNPNCNSFYCSGSLISETMVLTSGTCAAILQCEGGQVYLGYNNVVRKTSDEQQIIASKKVFVHENFTSASHNDIAIVELQDKVKINSIVKTIKLDQSTYDHSNQNGLVTGWGSTASVGLMSSDLAYYENPIISNKDCDNNTAALHSYIEPIHICLTGKGNRRIFNTGDLGSPLVVEGIQVGIGLYGLMGGDPSVFTRVSEFESWIRDKCPDCQFAKTSSSNNLYFSWFLIITTLAIQKTFWA